MRLRLVSEVVDGGNKLAQIDVCVSQWTKFIFWSINLVSFWTFWCLFMCGNEKKKKG